MIDITSIGVWNRTTVPKNIRKKLDLNQGDKISWCVDEKGNVIIKK